MSEQFIRTELMLGKSGMGKLYSSRVAVFGVGGVGGFAVEALARSGVGAIDMIDPDIICISNINRQIFATHKTLGKYKVDVASERVCDINPSCAVNTFKLFYMPENAHHISLHSYDYVIDAIDTVTAKIELITRCVSANIPIISSMGAGNKMNASELEVSDIYKTSVCPLAKVMRKELKARGIKKLKVVYSKENPKKLDKDAATKNEKNTQSFKDDIKHQIPGSNAFVPPAAGLIIAGEVVKDLTNII